MRRIDKNDHLSAIVSPICEPTLDLRLPRATGSRLDEPLYFKSPPPLPVAASDGAPLYQIESSHLLAFASHTLQQSSPDLNSNAEADLTPKTRAPRVLSQPAEDDVFSDNHGSQGNLILPGLTPTQVTKRKIDFIGLDESARASKRRRTNDDTDTMISDALRVSAGKNIGLGISTQTQSSSNGMSSQRSANGNFWTFSTLPPTRNQVLATMPELGIPSVVYKEPFYSRATDAPNRPKEYGGLTFHIQGGTGVGSLPDWAGDHHGAVDDTPAKARKRSLRPRLEGTGVFGWEFAAVPPGRRDAERWMRETRNEALLRKQREARLNSQVSVRRVPKGLYLKRFIRSKVQLKPTHMDSRLHRQKWTELLENDSLCLSLHWRFLVIHAL